MHKLNKTKIKNHPQSRLYQLEIPIIGLTGSIATGKSTVAKFLTRKRIPLIDADQLVKEIYKTKECMDFISQLCPESIHNDMIDFKTLRQVFFAKANVKAEIEKFIYKRLPEQFNLSLSKLDFSQYNFVVYDVPLLFEKNLKPYLDLTVVCYSPANIQIERLMRRDAITRDQANTIIESQMDIEDKKHLADFVIDNSFDKAHLEKEIEKFLSKILQ